MRANIQVLQTSVDEYANYRAQLDPQLEKAREEIELNECTLRLLDSQVQTLHSERMALEKRLSFGMARRSHGAPCIIVEEDEEDLEEEKRNEANPHSQEDQEQRSVMSLN